jgi:hypothetical protein
LSRADDLLLGALKRLPAKPPDTAKSTDKKRYSELMSQFASLALADELRQRGLAGTRPSGELESGTSGAERRMSGGIGAKKVDITWATEESGLLLAISVKCITARDVATGNYQKNLINRRGDMLGEAVTLHRRFPYAVLGGFLFLDSGAAHDASAQRSSTFRNAHRAFRIFTGRTDPAGRDEQYERFYLALVDVTGDKPTIEITHAGEPDTSLTLDIALDALLKPIADRDPDFYTLVGPAGEIDPPVGMSPLTLARTRTSGTITRSRSSRTGSSTTSWLLPMDSNNAEDDE